jgi:hypothetical protein
LKGNRTAEDYERGTDAGTKSGGLQQIDIILDGHEVDAPLGTGNVPVEQAEYYGIYERKER